MNAEEILNGPDYFYCERMRIRMKKVLCAGYQDGSAKPSYGMDRGNFECKDCPQGKDIAAGFSRETLDGEKAERKVAGYNRLIEHRKVKKIQGVNRRGTVPVPVKGEKTMTDLAGKKVCKVCVVLKPLDEFPKNDICKDGYEGQCKKCKIAKAKQRRHEKKREKLIQN